MHDYIGIDFWSQMSWNPSIAKLQTFVDKGHDTIYNINASFFYYVLRNDKPTDGREQHSFDNLNADKKIFEEFTPGKFQSNTVDDNSAFIKGASLGIWCDNPNLVDEEVIMDDIHDEMRALASKSWNTQSNANYTFEQFKESYTKLGNVAGYEKGTKLPYSDVISFRDFITEMAKSEKILNLMQMLFMDTDYFLNNQYKVFIKKRRLFILLYMNCTVIKRNCVRKSNNHC